MPGIVPTGPLGDPRFAVSFRRQPPVTSPRANEEWSLRRVGTFVTFVWGEHPAWQARGTASDRGGAKGHEDAKVRGGCCDRVRGRVGRARDGWHDRRVGTCDDAEDRSGV